MPSYSFKTGTCTTNRQYLLRTSIFDDELADRIGYEAAEDVPEKHPLMLHNLSKRLVKAMWNHDLDLLCDPTRESTHNKRKPRLSKSHKRLSPDFYVVGETVNGRICAVFPTYSLVDIGSTCYGVLHARDMSDGWVDRVDLSLTPGDVLTVYIKSVDLQVPTIRLSLRELSDVLPSSRRPVHSFKIEEIVSGRIVRKSPLGFYVDIGATVDAFLHKNDRKLPKRLKEGNRSHLKVGTIIPILYIKGVDLIKNRIQLSENSLREELDKRVLTGDETLGQQAVYLNDPKRDIGKELRINELEQMKQIGGYDTFLSEIGGHRNSTMEYILYLENIRKQKELEKQQEKLFQDTSTDEKLQRDKETFNELSHAIADLNEIAFEPKSYARSIYKYADSCVWNSRVYTPFNETDTDSYFGTITDELTSALRDVQGENFNFTSEFDFNDNNLSKDRNELIESLWHAFNAPPSKLSNIPNDVGDMPLIDETSFGQSSDGAVLKRRDERISKMILDLESTNDPEDKEIAEMLREARTFQLPAYSEPFIDDYESDIKGASALFGDDVSTWTDRARCLVSSSLSHSDGEVQDYIYDTLSDDQDSISDIPQDVLEKIDYDEQGFVKPIITQRCDGFVNKETINKDSDIAFEGINTGDCFNAGPETNTDSSHVTVRHDYMGDSYAKHKASNCEKINFRKLCKVLKRDLQDCEGELSKIDFLSTNKFPIAVQENNIRQTYNHESSDIASILQCVKEIAKDPSQSHDKESRYDHTNYSDLPNYLKMRNGIEETKLLDDTHLVTSEDDTNDLSNQSNIDLENACYPPTSGLDSHEMISDDTDTDIDGTLNHLLRSKNGLKQLARFAKKFLSPNELRYINELGKDTQEEEEFAKMMRRGKGKEKERKYTYYPEGIYNCVPSQDNRTEAEKVLDSKRMLENLKKNRRFLMMLKRLDVDPYDLSFDNILDKLPRKFIFERLPPFAKLKNG